MSFFTPQPQVQNRRLGDATNPPTGNGTGSTPEGWVKRFTSGAFLTTTDLVSGAIAAGVGMAAGQNQMSTLRTAGIQVGSSLIGRKLENIMPASVSTLTPLVSFAVANAGLNALSGKRKNLLQKVAVGTAIDLASSSFMGTESSVF
jgi:hypothetical protein